MAWTIQRERRGDGGISSQERLGREGVRLEESYRVESGYVDCVECGTCRKGGQLDGLWA